MRKLFAEGAFSTAYIPSFANMKNEDEETGKLIGKIFAFQLVLFIPLIILCFLYSRNIIEFLSSFKDDYQIVVSSSLLPLFILFLVFISFSSIYSGVLQARGSFFIVGISPIFYSISVIFLIIFFAPAYGHLSFGFGAIVGSLLQFMVCFIKVKRLKIKTRLSFDFKDEAFLKVLSRILPVTLTSVILMVSQQLIYSFATLLSPGSITAFANSIILYQAPYGIFFVAISTVYYPEFNKEHDNMKRVRLLEKGLSDLLCFLLPSSIILVCLNKEIISLFFLHGAFTLENLYMTSSISIIYFCSLVVIGFYALLQRYCYSLNKYWLTTNITLFISVLDLILTYIFIKIFDSVNAIAYAFLISQTVGLVILLSIIGNLNIFKLLYSNYKTLVVNLILLFFSLLVRFFKPDYYLTGTSLRLFILTAFAGLFLFSITTVLYLLLKIPFIETLKKQIPQHRD